MAFVEDMIFEIISFYSTSIIIYCYCFLVLLYIVFFVVDILCFWKGTMKWWVSLLACAWGLLFKAMNSKVGLRLRGASRSFEGGFTNSALG